MAFSDRIYPVVWQQNKVLLVDRTRLPKEYSIVEIDRSEDIIKAIETKIVGGASAIGIAAAYGMYLGALEITTSDRHDFLQQLETVAKALRETRPTVVNLSWAVSQMLKVAYESLGSIVEIEQNLLETAQSIQLENLKICRQIGNCGLSVLPTEPQGLNLLTHCNAGALASAGYGTALGIVRAAWRDRRLQMLYVGETRPGFEGAKLTAWECLQEKIPVTVITDNMAAYCMKQKAIDAVIVGADSIAANGDTANTVGTYSLALTAKALQIPFYVAAPFSTIDFELPTGEQILVRERDASEIYKIDRINICPPEAGFYNPERDVTPASLITAIITERGAIAPDGLIRCRDKILDGK